MYLVEKSEPITLYLAAAKIATERRTNPVTAPMTFVKMVKVLNFAPDKELRQLRSTILSLHNCYVVTPATPTEALDEMKNEDFDLLLLCHEVRARDMTVLCETFKRRFPSGRIVLLEYSGEMTQCCGEFTTISAHDPDEMVAAVTGKKGKLLSFILNRKVR
jgi:CheY-like chemotaxis protein